MADQLVTYRVEGADDTARALARLRAATDGAELVQPFGDNAAERARGLVRVATGALRGTIRVEPGAGRLVLAAGSPDSPQAGVLNYGSAARNIAADEFLTGPGLDEQRAAEHVEDGLERTVHRLNL